jgi:hypothetical protein
MHMLVDFGVFQRHKIPTDAFVRQVLAQVLEIDVDWAVTPRLLYTDPFYAVRPTTSPGEEADLMSTISGDVPLPVVEPLLDDPEVVLAREKAQQRELVLSWFRPVPGKEEVAFHGTQIALNGTFLLYPQFLQSLVVIAHIIHRQSSRMTFTFGAVNESLRLFLYELASHEINVKEQVLINSLVTAPIPPIMLPRPATYKVHTRFSIVEENIGRKPAPKKK